MGKCYICQIPSKDKCRECQEHVCEKHSSIGAVTDNIHTEVYEDIYCKNCDGV